MEVDAGSVQIFNLAKRTADMLVNMFGSRCEVAVHDFKDLKHSLVYLAGNVTGRKVGGPITDLVLTELRKDSSEIRDIPNYKTQARNGTVMKSSTVFLRDMEGKVVGALCINYDITQMLLFAGDVEEFLGFDASQSKSENFHSTVQEVIHDMVDQVISGFKKAPGQLMLEEKVECVRLLEEKGAFLIKGSTDYLAGVLGVSKFTIYNYLQKIRTQNEYQMQE